MIEPTSQPGRCGDRVEAVLSSGEPTPMLVIDLDVVADHYRRLVAALSGGAATAGTTVLYAVKANPHPEILRLLVEMGAGFDVASRGEIDACIAAGASPDRLSFGNTVKRRAAITTAWGLGIRQFAFDAAAELDKVLAAAPGASVTCRLRFDGGGAAWPLSDKFGCGPEAAAELLLDAHRRGASELGVSFHVGSQQRRPEAWDEALAAVGMIADELAEAGAALGLVNLGGGLPSGYGRPLAGVDDYVRAMNDGLVRHLDGHDVRLVIEPGRYLVAEAGVIQAEVLLVSRRGHEDGRRWVYLDVGVYSGLVETAGGAIRYPIRTPHDGGPSGPAVVAGPTCDSVDVLCESELYDLPLALAEGDRVELFSAGAYTTACATTGFNGFPPMRERVLPPS